VVNFVGRLNTIYLWHNNVEHPNVCHSVSPALWQMQKQYHFRAR